MFGDQSWTRLVSQSCHGRVTIPIAFRRALGIADVQVLEMTLVQGELRIRQVATTIAVPQHSGREDDDGGATREDADTHAGVRQNTGDGDPLT